MLIIEQNECDALVGGVALGKVDCPASRLQQFAVVGFPLIADAGAAVRDETRQIGMIGDLFTRLFDCILNGEDKQRMPACPDSGSRASIAAPRPPKAAPLHNAKLASIDRG